ncbi:S-methyl-5-thioribose-1-phosphate isomerase [Thermocrinis jamiesonii]|jgi:S-methyl-5-thioribose-1-phosphate isomerase|uniref:S-methyl-5-thioribose-1-phosphate isomerase n=1 Tax=Thermocrinis jamiesonii TaxID=1302351 RepID=UPI0004962B51|nr:S-methyl-5-thioribose-1-phosphate isomerase [Thermocrinis jamiesonii]
MQVKAFRWDGQKLWLLDQRKLPDLEEWIALEDHLQTAQAIKDMVVRGAPAIGCVSAYGFVLGVKKGEDPKIVYEVLRNTRPTAYNLFYALDRMMDAYKRGEDLEATAKAIEEEDYQANVKMAQIGNELIPKNARILTHCNTGALATAGFGTALGVIRQAHYSGKSIFVWVDETRPYLQGSRLTAWELLKEGIPHKIITDSTAGFLMKKGLVDCVIVGADRITKRGDVANKIGTYALSVLAKTHRIPFYVVAPSSTIDYSIESGEEILIEERSEEEVKRFKNCLFAPEGSPALHLAFDITPAENITAIITEKGIWKPT